MGNMLWKQGPRIFCMIWGGDDDDYDDDDEGDDDTDSNLM
jgi:hypothetical protein